MAMILLDTCAATSSDRDRARSACRSRMLAYAEQGHVDAIPC
jgi:hypothetical protein